MNDYIGMNPRAIQLIRHLIKGIFYEHNVNDVECIANLATDSVHCISSQPPLACCITLLEYKNKDLSKIYKMIEEIHKFEKEAAHANE